MTIGTDGLDHGENGVDWPDGGIQPKCTCGWIGAFIPLTYGWDRKLFAEYNQHLADVGL